MKTLGDKTGVYDRMYYYLLDWNDQNEWEYITTNFNKTKLNELTQREFIELWEFATTQDKEEILLFE